MKKYLVVLGGGLDLNEEPNEITKLRLDKAIELENNYDYIIVSSDRSWRNEINKHKISEAKVGQKYLISKGIKNEKIILEEKSRDTFSNAYYLRKLIIDPKKIKSFDVITSDFHLKKTKLLFNLVFPKKEYKIDFIGSKSNKDDLRIQLKIKSEKELIKFYKANLKKTYNIKEGDMNSIKVFMEKYNPAYTGIKDKYHEELTNKVNEKLKQKNYSKIINEQTYDSVHESWDEKRKNYWKPVQEFIEKSDNKNSFLDIGCGGGRFLDLAKMNNYKKIIGTDISKNQLETCKKKGHKTLKADMIHLPLEDNSFDTIICVAAHHHLLDKDEQLLALKEMKRVLNNKGRLLLSNWFPSKDFVDKNIKKKKFQFIDKQKVRVTFEHENKKYDRYYYFFKEKELVDLCKKAGFNVIDKEYNNGNLYLTLS